MPQWPSHPSWSELCSLPTRVIYLVIFIVIAVRIHFTCPKFNYFQPLCVLIRPLHKTRPNDRARDGELCYRTELLLDFKFDIDMTLHTPFTDST